MTERPRVYSDEWWERLAANNPRFGTVEQTRDSLDPGWRAERRRKELAAEAAKQPAREISPGLGRSVGRVYRQVNVKLGEADFQMLCALAITRDLPPATLARTLLRAALRDAAG